MTEYDVNLSIKQDSQDVYLMRRFDQFKMRFSGINKNLHSHREIDIFVCHGQK